MKRLLLTLAALALALPALAGDREAMDAYKKGVDAVQAGRHADAIPLLQEALAQRSNEGSFKVGVVINEFAPSRWLAEAHLGLGHCAEAAKYLQAARGVKMGAKERAGLDALAPRVEACGGGAPKPTAPPVAAATAPPAPAACPQLADAKASLRVGDSATALRLARECLKANPADEGAKTVVAQVDAIVAGKLTAALREEAAGNAEQALSLAKEAVAIDGANEDASAMRTRLERAIAAKPAGASAAVVAAAKPSAPAGTRPSAPAGATVPAATAPVASAPLPAGVAAYFRGDLDAAIRALEAQGSTPELQLVMACALASRGLLAGDDAAGQRDLQNARQAWEQAHRVNPKLSLDARWISPRVRAALSGS